MLTEDSNYYYISFFEFFQQLKVKYSLNLIEKLALAVLCQIMTWRAVLTRFCHETEHIKSHHCTSDGQKVMVILNLCSSFDKKQHGHIFHEEKHVTHCSGVTLCFS